MLSQFRKTVSPSAPKKTYETPSLRHIGRAQDVVLRGAPGPYLDSQEPLGDSGGQFPG